MIPPIEATTAEQWKAFGVKLHARMAREGLTHTSQISFAGWHEVGPATAQMQRWADHMPRVVEISEDGTPRRRRVPYAMYMAVVARDGMICRHCGIAVRWREYPRDVGSDTLHLDHLLPVCRGGENSLENLVVSCALCNLSRGWRAP